MLFQALVVECGAVFDELGEGDVFIESLFVIVGGVVQSSFAVLVGRGVDSAVPKLFIFKFLLLLSRGIMLFGSLCEISVASQNSHKHIHTGRFFKYN